MKSRFEIPVKPKSFAYSAAISGTDTCNWHLEEKFAVDAEHMVIDMGSRRERDACPACVVPCISNLP